MRLTIPAVLLLVMLVPVIPAQVTVYVPDNVLNGANCNVIGLGGVAGWNNYTYAARIPASYLTSAAGLQRLNEISFAPCNSGTWTCGTVRIGVGHVATPLPNPFTFPVGASIGSFLDFTVLYDSAVQGPLSLTVTTNTWFPLGFANSGGTTFCWNGVSDVAYFITFQGAVATGAFIGDCNASSTEPFRLYASGYNAPMSTGSGTSGLKMKLDFAACGPVVPFYETNDAASHLDFNGIQGNQFVKAVTNVCTGAAVIANVSSTGVGLLWEAGYNFSSLVRSTNPGSFTTGGGQYVNLDLTGGLYFFFGGSAPAPIPFPGNFAGVFGAGSAPGILSMQMINGNPAHPDGMSLSQGCELVISGASLPTASVPGPNCDDCETMVNVGCITGLYGRTYSTLFMESNGRLMFGGGNTSFSPSVTQFAADAPSFGAWTDWNPGGGGSVTLTQPVPGLLRVNYSGIPYFGTTTSNTFALIYDTITGIVSIDGLLGIGAGSQQMLIGLSGGNQVNATVPAMVNFSPATTTGSTFNATDVIYRIGTGGSVTPGVNRIDFYPNAYQNYDWISS